MDHELVWKILETLSKQYDEKPTEVMSKYELAQILQKPVKEIQGILIYLKEKKLINSYQNVTDEWVQKISAKGTDELKNYQKPLLTEKPLEFDVSHEDHTGEIKVFISHKFVESDQILADTLRKSLAQHNIYGYLAERKKEYDIVFGDKIKQEIISSDYLIAIITKNSNLAPSVHQEIGYAIGVEIPVRIMAEEQEVKGVLVEGKDIEKFSRESFEKSLDNIIKDIQKNGIREKSTDKEREILVKNHIDSMLSQFILFKDEHISKIPNQFGVHKRRHSLKDILTKFPTGDCLIAHLFTDENNKKIFDILLELIQTENSLKTLNQEITEIQQSKIFQIIKDLASKENFEFRGQSITDKQSNQVVFVSDIRDGFDRHLSYESKDDIQVLPSEHKNDDMFNIRFPGWGTAGRLTKKNAQNLADGLNLLKQELSESIKQVQTLYKKEISLELELETSFNSLMDAFKIKTEPLDGCCKLCLSEKFRMKKDTKSFKNQILKIPWSLLGYRKEESLKYNDFITIRKLDSETFEICIDDSDIKTIDQAWGMPHVQLNNNPKKNLQMIQAIDGMWYAYIGIDDKSQDELVSLIGIIPKPNDSQSIISVTGIGQRKIQKEDWPIYQKTSIDDDTVVTYGRGGKDYSLTLKF